MSTASIIFIVILICVELDFFVMLFCRDMSALLAAKADEIHARAESIWADISRYYKNLPSPKRSLDEIPLPPLAQSKTTQSEIQQSEIPQSETAQENQ